jgi:RNA polymerase sigma-70 factor (sigma-E family)
MNRATRAATDRAYVAFVESAWSRHLRLAVLLTGDRWLGEDLLQDTLVNIYARWRRLAQHDDLHAYLRRALVNNNTSMWRRRRRERLVAEVPDRAVPPGGGHPDSAELRAALLTLSPKQRAVVVLRHYEDLPEREVARLLGCTVGTVKSMHARAIGRLRTLVPEPSTP